MQHNLGEDQLFPDLSAGTDEDQGESLHVTVLLLLRTHLLMSAQFYTNICISINFFFSSELLVNVTGREVKQIT